MRVKTASWFTKLPPDHARIGISRGVPRGQSAGYKRYRALEPGPWFNSCAIPEYLERYGAILAALDPRQVADELAALADGRTPVLLCWENPAAIKAGSCWCHRSLAGQWLQDRLGIQVEEIGHPLFDPWARLRMEGVAPPVYG